MFLTIFEVRKEQPFWSCFVNNMSIVATLMEGYYQVSTSLNSITKRQMAVFSIC